MKRINKLIIEMMFVMLLLASFANANLELESIHFDPAIIAAGDEVDIVIQYKESATPFEDDKIGNEEYKFQVILDGDDDLTRDYVIIQDGSGNDRPGQIFAGETYNKVFRVKVLNNAPAGNYEFKLTGQWFKNEIKMGTSEYLRFYMPVKKEGIILGISTINTFPAEIKPGEEFVKLITSIENVGEKDSKGVEIILKDSYGISPSYANNNRLWVGRVNAGESKEVTFYIDIDEEINSGVYDIGYSIGYKDLDDNGYLITNKFPLLVKPKPNIEVISYSGEGLSGSKGKLYVTLKNIGEESAESVDVRILKQNSQPFDLDVRSDYVGELEPGEEGVAVFDLSINSDAEIKEHDFKLLIRAKGDSDEGDDNIYVFNRRAKFDVNGHKKNYFAYIGIILGLILVFGFIIKKVLK